MAADWPSSDCSDCEALADELRDAYEQIRDLQDRLREIAEATGVGWLR
ncbi:MAG: hypothetical protein LBV78_04740 [Kitasatospora sp.]|jgi:hypothetical protein|nr:hypothetical protein [Kitasatospora sp.]